MGSGLGKFAIQIDGWQYETRRRCVWGWEAR